MMRRINTPFDVQRMRSGDRYRGRYLTFTQTPQSGRGCRQGEAAEHHHREAGSAPAWCGCGPRAEHFEPSVRLRQMT